MSAAEAPSLSVAFTNCSTPADGLTYFWDFGDDSTGTEEDPTHTYSAPGLYMVTLVATSTGGCGVDSVKHEVEVDTTVTADLYFAPDPAYLQPPSYDRPSDVELRVCSSQLIAGVSCEIQYDHTKVHITQLELGSFLSGNGGSITDFCEFDNEIGQLLVTLGVVGGDSSGVSGCGTLLTLEVSAVAEDPTSEIEFVSADLRDPSNASIPVETDDGSLLLADNLLGDYDNDGDVDFSDFTYFIWCWNEPGCTDCDIASAITGEHPAPPPWTVGSYSYPPDGECDFEDLMVFIMMYNWSGQFNEDRGSGGGLKVPVAMNEPGTRPEAPSQVELHERFAVQLELADASSIAGYRFALGFDDEVLSFQGTNLEELLKTDGNRIFSHDTETESGVEICRAVLGETPAEHGGACRVEFYFEAIKEVETTSVTIDEIDLRTTANRRRSEDLPDAQVTHRISVGRADASLPTRFAMWQNTPNPFATTTTIRFDLPEASRVELRVYDVQGRNVKTIVNGTLAAGTHNMTWNGRNDQGNPMASGIYFCGLKAAGHNLMKRMLLMR